MSNKTNDEKLRILKERLAQISEKKDSKISKTEPIAHEKKIKADITVDTSNTVTNDTSNRNDTKKSNNNIKKYLLAIFIIIGSVLILTNINFNTLLPEETTSKTILKSDTTKSIELKYNLKIKGNNIAIISNHLDESSAKAEKNNLLTKGFKTDYFFLPENSNSNKNVYQVFIGPYQTQQETNQWIKNIDKEISIISLKDGSLIEKIKNSYQIEEERIAKENEKKQQLAKENEKKQKLAKENEERQRLAKENEKKQKLAKENEEKQRIAKENEKKQKIAKENKEKQRLAKENKEKQRIAKESKEKQRIAKENKEKQRLAKENKEKQRIARKNKEKQKLTKENKRKIELKNETLRLKREIEQLKNRKQLLSKGKNVLIKYSYKFTPTLEDEGYLIISNNAGYPIIKRTFINIKSQGGSAKLIKDMKYIMKRNGLLIDDVFFQKSGKKTKIYKGSISELYY